MVVAGSSSVLPRSWHPVDNIVGKWKTVGRKGRGGEKRVAGPSHIIVNSVQLTLPMHHITKLLWDLRCCKYRPLRLTAHNIKMSPGSETLVRLAHCSSFFRQFVDQGLQFVTLQPVVKTGTDLAADPPDQPDPQLLELELMMLVNSRTDNSVCSQFAKPVDDRVRRLRTDERSEFTTLTMA